MSDALRRVGRRYVVQCRSCRRWFMGSSRDHATLMFACHVEGVAGVKACPGGAR